VTQSTGLTRGRPTNCRLALQQERTRSEHGSVEGQAEPAPYNALPSTEPCEGVLAVPATGVWASGRDRMLIAASSRASHSALKPNFSVLSRFFVEQRVGSRSSWPEGINGLLALPLGPRWRRAVQPRRPSPASKRGRRCSPQAAPASLIDSPAGLRRSDWVRPGMAQPIFKKHPAGNRVFRNQRTPITGRREPADSLRLAPLADVPG